MKPIKQPKPDQVSEANPEWTATMLAEAKPAADIPELQGILKARGRPKAAITKKSTTLRLDAEVIEYFKQSGKGWQTRVNEVLKEYASKHS